MAYIIKKALTLNGKKRKPGEVVGDGEFLPRRALALVRTGMIVQADIEVAVPATDEPPVAPPENENPPANDGDKKDESPSEPPENEQKQPEKADEEKVAPVPEKAEKKPKKAKNQGDA